jgi:hypothetical protein
MFSRGFRWLIQLSILLVMTVVFLDKTVYEGYGVEANQESLEKSLALRFLEEVVCVDLTAYDVRVDWEPMPVVMYAGHEQTCVRIWLTSADGEFRFRIEFIDGRFYYCFLTDENGILVTKSRESISLLESASSILERYRLSFNATYCNSLNELLGEVTHVDSEQEIKTDDCVLTVMPPSNKVCANFRWTFQMNNIACADRHKGLAMGIYSDGLLSWLMDAWGHYEITSAEVNLSEEEAIDIALSIVQTTPDNLNEYIEANVELIQKHLTEEGARIARYEATLRFDNRRGDCFTLDAAWIVDFHYDKIYGSHYGGFMVYIWADNRQIFDVSLHGAYGYPDQTEASEIPLDWLTTLVLTAAMIPFALRLYRKYRHPRNRTESVTEKTLHSTSEARAQKKSN